MTDDQGWITSSRTGSGQQCVQMKPTPAGIALRDSKNPSGTRLLAAPDVWRLFLAHAQRGFYDPPSSLSVPIGDVAKPAPGDLDLGRATWLDDVPRDEGRVRLSVAFVDGHVAVRSLPSMETLVFNPAEWLAWLFGAKAGEFDHLA
ncbi:DUF397 domain-containing protein [Sphaerisporangium corydalis]|uniref:DUF397 domain-containing protein n=1 Tax=Sphaerisporangium corydalis TaxID=1441875 RepID=A0ABV9EE34_9ACTN|nr:DUF397 domain-containing protein [Sphaerisporangium corydalis]